MTDQPILIAGGGIGGLAAACGLAKIGRRSVVVDQAPQFGEIGAGIQIGPNAFHCFDYLGVGDEARSKAVYIDALRLMDAQTAEDITHIPLDEPFRKFFGNPYAVVHRADLHGVLLKLCEDSPLVDLRTEHTVTGYEQDGDSVTLTFKNHDPVTGAVLIGAEGLRSPIRAQLVGDGEPRISGHTTYRSVIPTEQMPEDLRWNAATLWAGPKCHIVHYPLSGWRRFNLVVTYHNDAPALDSWLFEQLGHQVREALAAPWAPGDEDGRREAFLEAVVSELQPFVGGRKKLARRAGLMMALLVDDEAREGDLYKAFSQL